MDIVVTGGTGLVGTELCKALHKLGHKVVIVSRHVPQKMDKGIDYIQANLIQEVPGVFSKCDAIIHLAGVNIFHRWTKKYKQLILDSRIKTIENIYHFLRTAQTRPPIFISASAVGFYGDRGEEMLDETSIQGTGFLAFTCVEWERAREKLSSLGLRTASIRTAAVLSPKSQIIAKMVPLFQWGLGGKLGSGRQWFPWIHLDDLVNIYVQAIVDARMTGSINAVAPGLIRNREFTEAVGSVVKKRPILSIPSSVLRLALGELSTALLASQKVNPQVLKELPFSFKYPTIEMALTSCIYDKTF